MRGFRIHYRNGETTLINSETGVDKGAIEFEETDILVGLTCLCTAPNDLKPRGFGFTVMRRQGESYVVHQTKILGNSVSNHSESWPAISTLENHQDVANMRIKEFTFSRWASGDTDLAGLSLKNYQGQSSEHLGLMKYAVETLVLQKKAIKKIDVMSKSGDAYMKGFVITYLDDESDVINSGEGYIAQTIEFGELDELVGITIDETS